MPTKRKFTMRIKMVNPTGLSDTQRAAVAVKYKHSHQLRVEFIGEYEFLHQEEFSLEYACTFCHVGIVLYAASHGIVIPDNRHTRRGIKYQIEALKAIVGYDVKPKDVEPETTSETTTEPNEDGIKGPSKEDFSELLNDGPSEGEKSIEIDSTEPVVVEPEVVIKTDEPVTTEPEVKEGEKQLKPLLQTKVIKNPTDNVDSSPTVETKVDVPEDLKCPHCDAIARTAKSYLNNHGDKCKRKVDTK